MLDLSYINSSSSFNYFVVQELTLYCKPNRRGQILVFCMHHISSLSQLSSEAKFYSFPVLK